MKKYIKILWIPILIICLLVSVLIIFLLNKDDKTECNFDMDDVLLQIDVVTNNSFYQLTLSEIFLFIPVDFNVDDKYVFAANKETGEYFLLAENLNEDQIFELKDFVETNNELYPNKLIKLEEYNKYIYVVCSKEYDSSIEGIIRSYIYC